ncbi:MAG: C39 family peptidase [Anaerolineae bacterium]|nr:C39 family peptidase [Anaerolineae bacterium]
MPKSPIIRLTHHPQEHSASCLAACVVMILSSWQVKVTEAEVRRIIKTKPYSGAHPVNLLRLSAIDFLGWPFESTVDELRQRLDRGMPLIAFLWTGSLAYWAEQGGVDYLHAVVVVGWTETSVWVHDPALPEGPTEISWAEFKDAWQYSRHMLAAIEPRDKA